MAPEKNRHSERGMALVLTMIMIVVVLGAVMLVSRQAISAKTQTDIAHNQFQLEEACKAGIDHGIQRVWNRYIVGNANVAGNWLTYKNFIDGIVGKNASVDLVTTANPLVLDAAKGVKVTGLSVTRADDINGFALTLNATGQVGNQSRTAQQTVRVGGSPFVGFDFAVLANNVSCILCHAELRNVFLDNNYDKTKNGTFERVKMASLQNLMYRPSSDIADSKVAGTIYTRGNVLNSYTKAAMSAADIANINAMATWPFNPPPVADNHPPIITIYQDPTTGAMGTPIKLTPVTTFDSDGASKVGGNLYLNFTTDTKLMKDAQVPTVFPAPYPDDNSNKIVDQTEYNTISSLLAGSVTGGVAFGVPTGTTYAGGSSFPTASNTAATSLAANGQYNGNLILTGTAANPIRMNGQIAVNGDLMLRGVVRGMGQLFVKGNTYIAGDVTYADGTDLAGKETYGVAADGTKNALGVITGGSVIMGDYQTIRGVNPSNDTAATPTSAYSIQTRLATRSASVTVGTKTETMLYGYKDPNVTDGNGMVAARGASQQASFTQAELMIFNNLEMAKAAADVNYKPRFYGLTDLQPNSIFLYDNPSSEHAIRYDEGAVTTTGTGKSATVLSLADYITKKGYASKNIATRATTLYLRPNQGWLPDAVLRQMWWDDEQSRTAANSIYKFDGLLYSNNAIFAITRSKARHGSNTEGRLRIRGAIICPDIGVLCAGDATVGNKSLVLQYDKRVKDFWAPQDRTTVTFQRQVYQLLPQSG